MLGELDRRINGRATVVALSVLVIVNTVRAVRSVRIAALVANIVSILVKMGGARTKCRAAKVTYVITFFIDVVNASVADVAFVIVVVVGVVV